MTSPSLKLSFSNSISKNGKYDSGVAVPNDSNPSKSPGSSPGDKNPVKLNVRVGLSPPTSGFADVILNKL